MMSQSPVQLSHSIAGEWLAASGQEWSADINPSNAAQVLACVPRGDRGVVHQAVEAALAAGQRWRATAGPQRADMLYNVAHALSQRRQDIAMQIALEVGKPLGEALQEVERGVVILRYFAGEAVHPAGVVIPAQQAGSLQFTLRQPLGPVAVISPWNFPLAIPLWKMAPALAYGNTVVWKPAETASLTATRLAAVFAEADLPAGVLNLVLGQGASSGAALVDHACIQAVTFTGSNEVGMGIAQQAARRNIKYQLEMGGKNAALVLADADLDQAASTSASGAMRYAGQKCTATSRAIVADEVRDAFLASLQAAIRALPLAPASDPACAVGPLVSLDAVERMSRYVNMGHAMGQMLVGGRRPQRAELGAGFFFEPTVVVDVPNDTPLAQDEIFGPLLVVQCARSLGEALSLANSTTFGLSVSLFTRDIDLRYIQDIQCGMVRVNGDTTGVDPHAPFGGMGASSSHSREQGPAALEFFTEIKTVQINPAGGR